MGHICTCARTDVSPFRISEMAGRIALEFGKWLETQVKLGKWPLVRLLTEAKGGAQLHVRTLFRILETAGRVEPKFDLWLETD